MGVHSLINAKLGSQALGLRVMGVPGIYFQMGLHRLMRVTLGVLDMKTFENHCSKGWAECKQCTELGLPQRLMNRLQAFANVSFDNLSC